MTIVQVECARRGQAFQILEIDGGAWADGVDLVGPDGTVLATLRRRGEAVILRTSLLARPQRESVARAQPRKATARKRGCGCGG